MQGTKLLYLTDSYKKTCHATVTKVGSENDQTYICLDQTIFYPLGGGQPTDQGVIIAGDSEYNVNLCLYKNGEVYHYIKGNKAPKVGDKVTCKINWDRRYKYMKVHSAGHIVDFAIYSLGLSPSPLMPHKGDHGKKPNIVYKGNVNKDIVQDLQDKVNDLINKDLEFTTQFKTKEEIEKTSIYVQSGLPSNKPLRVLILKGVGEVPDGGTQVKSTKECKGLQITGVQTSDDQTIVSYKVNEQVQTKEQTNTKEKNAAQSDDKTLQLLKQDLKQVKDTKSLTDIKLKYLGKSGVINELAKQIKNIPVEEKATFGQKLNALKQVVTNTLVEAENQIKQAKQQVTQDYSLPKYQQNLGSIHPTTHAVFEIEDILGKIGFIRKEYRETDNDYYPFESLNMPINHPARDEWETFFLENGKFVLTPHTSNGQVREMENKKPPIKMLNIARTYRRQITAKHSPMFHQFEGLYVDKNVSIAHLKGTLDYFVKAFFGKERETRIRPYHFKFTEPSFEVDVTCNKCNGKGCKVCKAGWLEIGGAGMVHPNVLKNGGVDPTKYSGFAFGFGVERPYMMKGEINIPDIRYFYSTNLDFLKHF